MDPAADGVVGREDEVRAITAWLGEHDSFPAAFVLLGEAGVGKSTLWRTGVAIAAGSSYRVLSTSPTESEGSLSFAGLGDLLEPCMDAIRDALPEPQRRALAVALLLEDLDGPPPEDRAISLGLLGALRALSADDRVLIAIDDLQWLDRPSASALAFALRRLRGEPVGLFCGWRSDPSPFSSEIHRAFPEGRVRVLEVGPLSLGATQRLLNDRLGLQLSRPELRRLHVLSGGNPFFALELGHALERGAVRLASDEPLPGELATLVADRLASLPDGTRDVLRAASALSQPTTSILQQVVGTDPGPNLQAALAAGVIALEGDRIRFTHPLLASAIYASGTVGDRRALHAALAEVVPDPEEGARHLARSAVAEDEGIARSLETEARRAHHRGALASAAELWEQARRLTPSADHEARHRRTVYAAVAAFETGDSRRMRDLLRAAYAESAPGRERSEVLYWQGNFTLYEGDRRGAAELFRRGIGEAGDDLLLRSRLEAGLADALIFLRSALPAAARHAMSALALAEEVGDERAQVEALIEVAFVDAVVGGGGWRDAIARARVLAGDTMRLRVTASPTYALGMNLIWVDELVEAQGIFRSLHERAEERGEESSLASTLAYASFIEYLVGAWDRSRHLALESSELARQMDQEPQRLFALSIRALVDASTGAVDARGQATDILALAEGAGAIMATIFASTAIGVLDLSLGDPDAAERVLGPLVERLETAGVREPGSMRFVPDEIEALIELGRLEEAEVILERLESRARRLDRASALAAAGRCRALFKAAQGDLQGALASFGPALEQHERVPIPFERARSLLALGRIRRRARMRTGAREALTEALEILERLGAANWADLTRKELGRIGGRTPAGDELTPSERRIAELVAEGKRNKEIASILVVADRTVESALTQVYRKLGIRSRAELVRYVSRQEHDADP